MDWDVIFSYSRKQAIEDGALVDASIVAKEASFRYPVVVTAAVWAMITIYPNQEATKILMVGYGTFSLWLLLLSRRVRTLAKSDMT